MLFPFLVHRIQILFLFFSCLNFFVCAILRSRDISPILFMIIAWKKKYFSKTKSKLHFGGNFAFFLTYLRSKSAFFLLCCLFGLVTRLCRCADMQSGRAYPNEMNTTSMSEIIIIKYFVVRFIYSETKFFSSEDVHNNNSKDYPKKDRTFKRFERRKKIANTSKSY